ncbi:MAG TPA: bifunctional nuclease family protein [Planctomycetes bacterium]|nr:bifunctional nuclease family protein [Planctomycetota bacterium]
MDLVKAEVERVIGTTGQDYAVVVRAEGRAFLIFVGQPEVVTIYRELKGETTPRPMPHDLVVNLMQGFDIEVRLVVISAIVDNVFCATLLMARRDDDESSELSHEVRLDLRASDAMIIALKTGSELYVTREVLEQTEDVSQMLPDAESE